MIKYIIVLIGALVAVFLVGWLGLQVKPKPFPAYPEQTPALKTVELPADLPAPVARYYETIIGDQIPVIESAVITGGPNCGSLACASLHVSGSPISLARTTTTTSKQPCLAIL